MRAFSTRLAPHLATLDDYASRWVPALVLALWPVAYGLAAGAAAFAWTHPGWASALEQNKVPERPALDILAWTAAGLALVVGIHVGAVARVRGRTDVAAGASVADVLALCRKRLRWTLGLPIAAALAWPGMENENAATVIALSALAAFAVASTVYGWSSPKSGAAPETAAAPIDAAQLATPTSAASVLPARARLEPLARAAGPLALAILIGGFIAIFWRMTLVNYRALHPHTIDLGLYDNIVWHAAHGDGLGSSFLKGGHHNSAHFDPILIALAPLYALRPRSDTLLVLQVVWASSALVPLYLLAREKLGSAVYGLGFAAMYAAHPAVHGAALYEFHSLTLVAPLLVWLVYLLERGSYRAFALVLVASLLCREDVALVVSFIALYAILRGDKERVRAGWLTMLACVAYFFVVKRFFMDSSDLLNSGPGTYGFSYYYADLIPNGNGGKGLAVSLLTNPGFVLRNVLVRPKLEFVAALLVPLALLPLAARPARTMLVYGAILLPPRQQAGRLLHRLPVLDHRAPTRLRDRRHRAGAGPALAPRRGARARRDPVAAGALRVRADRLGARLVEARRPRSRSPLLRRLHPARARARCGRERPVRVGGVGGGADPPGRERLRHAAPRAVRVEPTRRVQLSGPQAE